MHYYRQSIVLFGFIAPLLCVALILGIGFFAKSKMTASFESKKTASKTYEQGRLAGLAIESEVTRQRPNFERWNHQLSQETASTVTSNLREVIGHLPSKEIQLSAFEPLAGGGIGAVSPQKSSQVRIALRGTYRTMQRAFLEMETKMPQLQLQDLKIDATSTQAALLNFQVTYTVWEN